MKNLIVEITLRFLIWFSYWGDIIDGISGILTLGYFHTNVALELTKRLAKFRWKHKKMGGNV